MFLGSSNLIDLLKDHNKRHQFQEYFFARGNLKCGYATLVLFPGSGLMASYLLGTW